MALGDRIRRLEDAAGLSRRVEGEADARRAKIMARMYHALANGRRALSGLDPLPTPPELEDMREDILHTLRMVIPHYRQHGGWRHGEGMQFLDEWQDRLLAELGDLERGEHTHG